MGDPHWLANHLVDVCMCFINHYSWWKRGSVVCLSKWPVITSALYVVVRGSILGPGMLYIGVKTWPATLYTIIRLTSVSLSVCQATFTDAILARSPREMSETDRILPRYFLSRVRVSVRPRIFFIRKKTPKPQSARSLTVRATDRQNGATIWKAFYIFTPGGDLRHNSHKSHGDAIDDFVGSPKPHAKRKLSALQRSSQARQRMRINREEAYTLPVPTPPSLGAGLRLSSLDRPGHDAGKRQLSEVSPSPPIIPSATMATDAALHSQAICTCISLRAKL